ncbi:MAG TPA: alpha/beta hydrolase [Thermoplasmata archaeon]|nr:alpha/beta hydrolase [Thermoplasmata archaeon]
MDGLIVSAPSVGNYQNLPLIGRMEISLPMLKMLTPILGIGAMFLPNFGVPGTQIDPQYLNHDKANYMAYAEDPLVCHEPMKLRFSAEAGKNILSLQDNAQNLKVPCLIMCGSEDMLVPPKSVKNFYENVQIEDKTFIEYEGFYHEIFNEGDNRRVYAGVDSWFLPRI